MKHKVKIKVRPVMLVEVEGGCVIDHGTGFDKLFKSWSDPWQSLGLDDKDASLNGSWGAAWTGGDVSGARYGYHGFFRPGQMDDVVDIIQRFLAERIGPDETVEVEVVRIEAPVSIKGRG